MADKCPVCGMPVRIVRRPNGAADHYEPIAPQSSDDLTIVRNKELEDWLKRERVGKKTVAMVGTATTTCALAPYEDNGVEIWSMNEAHAYKWMVRATRWFQIHDPSVWKINLINHENWLKENPMKIPIYTRYFQSEIPQSIEYPISRVRDRYMSNLWRGQKNKPNYFTSSFAYMLPFAMLEGFNRIELYGFEMSDDTEYVNQKSGAEFWLGQALGKEVEIYLPEGCHILYSRLYGDTGGGW